MHTCWGFGDIVVFCKGVVSRGVVARARSARGVVSRGDQQGHGQLGVWSARGVVS